MSFVERFWSPGYGEGLESLFEKLGQGIVENSEILALALARAEAEDVYGQKLRDIPRTQVLNSAGFGRDDGATTRRSYEGIIEEMGKEGERHTQVALNIQRMVIEPFSKWADSHRQRVEYSQTALRQKVKQYHRELTEVERSQKRYFNRCRIEEDASDQAQAAVTADDDTGTTNGSSESELPLGSESKSLHGGSQSKATSEELILNGKLYSSDEAQALVDKLLSEVPKSDVKVPIWGTYENCSSGSDITSWIMANTEATKIGDAEQVGQDLVNAGILRFIGVGSKFANSSVMKYQWHSRAWAFAGRRHHGSFLGDLSERWSTKEDETSIKELDQKYRKNVAILDNVRCELEELMSEHLQFLERCERDRLKAVKSVMLDLVATLSNIVPGIQASVDKYLLYQETADPSRDVRFLVETYATGIFLPKVVVYDNYYSSVDGSSVFGTDLELRSRGDRKHVPAIVSAALSYMDSCYPTMENDEQRLTIWSSSDTVSLRDQHALRKELNHLTQGSQFRQALQNSKPPIVAATLRLYFLELPDSLVSTQLYDVLRSVYQQFGSDRESRLTALQNSLAGLRVSHIATLDALTAHFKRLITIANAKPENVDAICKWWGPALVRPRSPSPLTLADTTPRRVLEDLLSERDALFRELKRLAARSPPTRIPSVSQSPTVTDDGPQRTMSRLDKKLKRLQLDRQAEKPAEIRESSAPTDESLPGSESENAGSPAPAFSDAVEQQLSS